MNLDFRHKLDQECKRIGEDSLYCAQTHYAMAVKAKNKVQWLIVAPASVAALLSFVSATSKFPECNTIISALAALLAAMAAIVSGLGYDSAVSNHRSAGNLFTALRHEAGSLREVYCETMTDAQYIEQIRLLRVRYNAYVDSTDMTDADSFEKASNKIKSGNFEYDVDKERK